MPVYKKRRRHGLILCFPAPASVRPLPGRVPPQASTALPAGSPAFSGSPAEALPVVPCSSVCCCSLSSPGKPQMRAPQARGKICFAVWALLRLKDLMERLVGRLQKAVGVHNYRLHWHISLRLYALLSNKLGTGTREHHEQEKLW